MPNVCSNLIIIAIEPCIHGRIKDEHSMHIEETGSLCSGIMQSIDIYYFLIQYFHESSIPNWVRIVMFFAIKHPFVETQRNTFLSSLTWNKMVLSRRLWYKYDCEHVHRKWPPSKISLCYHNRRSCMRVRVAPWAPFPFVQTMTGSHFEAHIKSEALGTCTLCPYGTTHQYSPVVPNFFGSKVPNKTKFYLRLP